MYRSLIKIIIAIVLLSIVTMSQTIGDDISTTVTSGKLAEGKKFETSYFIKESSVNGPTVLVVAGMHGDSPAGIEAAEQILSWNILSGKLIVVPRANMLAITINARLMPVNENRNLNRNFPGKNSTITKCELSQYLWDFTTLHEPDWVIDLDEDPEYRSRSDKHYGNSIMYYPDTETLITARRMGDDAERLKNTRKYTTVRYPPDGSLTKSSAENFGSRSMVLTTTRKSENLSTRVEQHTAMLDRLLKDIGMFYDDSVKETKTVPKLNAGIFESNSIKTGEIRIAIYDGGGAQEDNGLRDKLVQLDNIYIENFDPQKIINGGLTGFDVIIVPGGFVSEQAKALTPAGLDQIRQFVLNGGGYIGFCAGAYLAANNFHWSLKIIDANVVDIQHWERGTGAAKIELTDMGKLMLGTINGEFNVAFGNGPILEWAENPDIPDYITLATYKSEINENDAPAGIMIDTPALIIGKYGMGRVFVSSPHPEATGGLDNLIQQALLWAAGRQLVIH